MKKHDNSIRERFPFRANSPLFHEVRKGGLVTEITPYFRGTVNISGGTTNGTGAVGEAATTPAAGFFSRFDLDAISKGVFPGGKLKQMTPRDVLRRRILDVGYYQGDLNATACAGAAGAYTFNLPFPLLFSLPKSQRSIETALNSDAYSGLQLQVAMAGGTNAFPGNDRLFDFSAAFVEIVDYREAVDTSDPKNAPAVLIETDVPVILNGANQRFTLKSELEHPEAFLDVLLLSETTGGALTDGLINKVTVKAGNDQWMDLYSDEIKGEMRRVSVPDYAGASITGLHHVPVVRDGLLMGALRNLEITLDVNDPAPGSDLITVSSRRIIFPQEFLPQSGSSSATQPGVSR